MAGNSHGHTPAAWTGVTIAFIGFCVAAAFVVLAEPIGMFAGLAVAALGGLVGLGMRAAGLGQQRPEKQRA
ncbi:HGxxPAAW family protein [Actinacidiphila sp. bgisy167]|uniref:HGxxPAAW family protein n=1 Tax=Actinacidiphila sp. bgisy167 TaxID=3413797 RepID=UPI003D7459D5